MVSKIIHELSAHRAYSGERYDLSYWKLTGGTEVDFLVGNASVAIEVKATRRVASQHLKGLREIATDHPRRILVCLEAAPRRLEAGVDVLPAAEFARRLWAGEITGWARGRTTSDQSKRRHHNKIHDWSSGRRGGSPCPPAPWRPRATFDSECGPSRSSWVGELEAAGGRLLEELGVGISPAG